MKDGILLQYIIDISDVTPAKKREATEYLARLEFTKLGVQQAVSKHIEKMQECVEDDDTESAHGKGET